jgi:hypothetical protein
MDTGPSVCCSTPMAMSSSIGGLPLVVCTASPSEGCGAVAARSWERLLASVRTGSNGLGVSSSGSLSGARGVLGSESRHGVSGSSRAAVCGSDAVVG